LAGRAAWKKAIVTLARARRSSGVNYGAQSYRPLTPIQRFKQTPALDEDHESGQPNAELLERRKNGRPGTIFGRLMSRHIGGVTSKIYRKVDSDAAKHGRAAEVMGIEVDPNRSGANCSY